MVIHVFKRGGREDESGGSGGNGDVAIHPEEHQ